MRNHPSPHRQAATILVRHLPTQPRLDVVTETISKVDQMHLDLQGISLLSYGREFMRLDDSSLIQTYVVHDPPAVVLRGSRRRPVADVRLRGSASRRRA